MPADPPEESYMEVRISPEDYLPELETPVDLPEDESTERIALTSDTFVEDFELIDFPPAPPEEPETVFVQPQAETKTIPTTFPQPQKIAEKNEVAIQAEHNGDYTKGIIRGIELARETFLELLLDEYKVENVRDLRGNMEDYEQDYLERLQALITKKRKVIAA